jgi:hypothetical protein
MTRLSNLDWRVRLVLSAGGYVVTLIILVWGFSSGQFTLPSWDALVWDRAGDEVRAGVSPYYPVAGSGGFYYAPPWAVLFALVSWLPVQVTAPCIAAAEVAAMRYMAGSWTRVGYMCWLPYVAFELTSGGWNLVYAAAIASAVRGDPRAAIVMTTAKLSPILAVRDQWRKGIPVALVLVAVTLPVLGLWADWIRQLVDSYGKTIAPGTQLLIPFIPRLAVAMVLVMTGRPWARIVGAAIATPALYPVSSVLLLALWPQLRRDGPRRYPVPKAVEVRP